MSTNPHERPATAERHTNSAAAFTMIAALFFLIGAVTFGTALEKRAAPGTCTIAAAPLLIAAGASAVAYSARRRAQATSQREEQPGEGRAEEAGPTEPQS